MTKLDYTLDSPEERKKLVEQILEENPDPSPLYLETLGDYLALCLEKQERKNRKILTDNRMTTINKRETSYEGLVSQLENGEDGIYNLMTDGDKNIIFQHKIEITPKDIEEIPFLKQLKGAIQYWENKVKTLSGRDAYIAKHTLIELRKDQYIIKNAYRKPVQIAHSPNTKFGKNLPCEEKIVDGEVVYSGVSLMDPKVCSIILCNYSHLKEEAYSNYVSDLWYLMEDFDKVADLALSRFPLYDRLVEYKVDGLQNVEIQEKLEDEFGIKHSIEYISSLWRHKIPKMIAATAKDRFLDWYFLNEERGVYKKCNRCGQIKLARNEYFSKNRTSKDGWYSICKECRNKRIDVGQK